MTTVEQSVLRVPLSEDLLPLSVLLHQRGVRHRIAEEGGCQVLRVADPAQADAVAELYRQWRAGEIDLQLSATRERRAATRPAAAVWQAPVTLLLIALSLCGFLLVYAIDAPELVAWLSFTPFDIRDGRITSGAMGAQYWRLITPIFLHFGWLHIVFNCLWLWELGHRTEAVIGHFNFLMLVLVVAVVSNASQYLYGGSALFGGMSGVVYGLLGFAWVAPLLQPRWPIQPLPAIMLLMVGWLVLCMVGVVEVLGFGRIANAAHLAGLLAGAALGLLFGALSRVTDDKA